MKKILFFDGVCVMCNGLINFALKHDHKHIFYFAPLQGETAQEKIPQYTKDLKSVVLLDEKGIHTESDAIIGLLIALGGIFSLAGALKIFPKIIRDSVYRWIARNRYRWFGKYESCRLPTAKERAHLLD
ncbi:MAG: DUF393 domain-containing protein [Myxococcales bacterium]|nr:DUF393 domain-containing protein [Myxococcales bacterium]USN51360.1 MAG: DUF393 domain-containing protein [Myxococcales bacterium]